jgi:hypothetical protein
MSRELTWHKHSPALYDNIERWYLRNGNLLVAVAKHQRTHWEVQMVGQDFDPTVHPRFKNAEEAKAYAVAIVTLEN